MSTILKSGNLVLDSLRELENMRSAVMEYVNQLDDVEVREIVNVHLPFTRDELLDRINYCDTLQMRAIYKANGLSEARDE